MVPLGKAGIQLYTEKPLNKQHTLQASWPVLNICFYFWLASLKILCSQNSVPPHLNISFILASLLNLTSIWIPALHITFTRKSRNQHEHYTSNKLEKKHLSVPSPWNDASQGVTCGLYVANCLLDTESRWVMSYWIVKVLEREKKGHWLLNTSLKILNKRQLSLLAGSSSWCQLNRGHWQFKGCYADAL